MIWTHSFLKLLAKFDKIAQNCPKTSKMLIQGQVGLLSRELRSFWLPNSVFPPKNWSFKPVPNCATPFWSYLDCFYLLWWSALHITQELKSAPPNQGSHKIRNLKKSEKSGFFKKSGFYWIFSKLGFFQICILRYLCIVRIPT